MADVLGWTALLVAAFTTLLLAVRNRDVAVVLAVAFVARAGAALFHFYVAPLPDGTADAVTFEKLAWEWGAGGVIAAMERFPGIDAYFYAWLMSLLYAVTDRSLLMLQAVSVLVGVLGVFATWRLAWELWGKVTARKAAWVTALFPMLVQYGALPMREAWVVVFLTSGLIGVVRWARLGGMAPIIGGSTAFLMASFFHGGMFLAILGFWGLVALRSGRKTLGGLVTGRVRFVSTLAFILAPTAIVGYSMSGVAIDKLGSAQEMGSVDKMMYYFDTRVHDGARYPQWTQPQNSSDFLWAMPLRGVYLLFSPFPWDVREPVHLVGLFDGVLYMALVWILWRHRRAILADPGSLSVLFLVGGLVLAFGVGTGNFGTGLRHRAKLVGALIALASPGLRKPVFRRSVTQNQNGSGEVSGLGGWTLSPAQVSHLH